MPIIYKIALSALAAIAIAVAHLLRDQIGLVAAPWHLIALAALMLVGLWIFPEPKKGPSRSG